MPLTLAALRAKELIAPVAVLGETVHLGFAPGRYSADVDDLFEIIRAAPDETTLATLTQEHKGAVRRILLELLTSWDILGDDDQPIAIDEANLRRLGPGLCLEFLLALGQANQPDPSKAPPSADGSDSGPTSSAPSQTGTS